MDNLYSKVRKLTLEKNNVSDEDFFLSSEYHTFIVNYCKGIINMAFAQLTLGEEVNIQLDKKKDMIIDNLKLKICYDTGKDSITAATNGEYVIINAGNELVTYHKLRKYKHLAILGFATHEIGHILYTDFQNVNKWFSNLSTLNWENEIIKGKWFQGENLRTMLEYAKEINCNMQNKNFATLFEKTLKNIENAVEDSYIENELVKVFEGTAKRGLATLNCSLWDKTNTLDDELRKKIDGKPIESFFPMMRQILMYAKFEELKVDDYNLPEAQAIANLLQLINELRYEPNSNKRLLYIDNLAVALYPYIKETINAQHNQPQQGGSQQPQQGGSQQPQQGGSQQPQQGGSQQPQQSGSQLQQGSGSKGQSNPLNSLSDAELDSLLSKLQKAANNAGLVTGDKKENGVSGETKGTTKPITVLIKNKEKNKAVKNSKDLPKDVKTEEVSIENIANEISQAKAEQKVETERIVQLQKEAPNVCLARTASIDPYNKDKYKKYLHLLQFSKNLQKQMLQIIKIKKQGEKLKNLTFGKRFDIKSVHHNDGKYFYNNKLPTNSPKFTFGLLIDESGSTRGLLSQASVETAVVIEDFCRSLNIPSIICGYTSASGGGVEINDYVEFEKADKNDKYRLMDIRERRGTPTAKALEYIIKRLEKRPEERKLLIVISDGGSDDNYVEGNGKKRIDNLVSKAKKKDINIIAAGIGSNRQQVENEFKNNFLDISNIAEMPKNLITVIRKNINL